MEKVSLIRKIKYKLGEKIYKWIKIYRPKFDTHPVLPLFEVVSNSYIDESVKIYPNCKIYNSRIGKYSYVSENSIIKETEIGRFCSIGPNLVCGSPMFYSIQKQNGYSLVDKNSFEEQKKIKIGNDVFIGMNVTILDGVTIGDGVIIGAGAVVSKSIPPYSIAIGCPIQIVGKRFEDSVVNDLLSVAWWNWDDDKLKSVATYFEDVNGFIDKNKSKRQV